MRGAGTMAASLAALALVLTSGWASDAAAQERTSRLDRVFHGLEYRALPEGAVAYAPSAGDPAGGEGATPSPHDPEVRYRADARVHRSTDGGASWEALSPVLGDGPLTAVAESPVEPGLVWAGGADGVLHLTRDGGRSWSTISSVATGLSGTEVRALVPSGYRGGSAYVVLDPAPGAPPEPLLFRTDDYGETWISLTASGSGFPEDEPVTAFVEDPEGSEVLFAGTPAGVHVSFNDGEAWDLFGLNLPQGAVSEFRIVGRDLVVATRDEGHYVLDEIGPLRQVMRGLLTGEPYLFQPSPALTEEAAQGTGLRSGAVFDFLLPSFVRGLRVEVLDHEGRWLRTLRGEEASPEGERPPRALAGIHRLTWDLTYIGDDGVERTAAPGTYTLRLDVAGFQRERTFEVLDSIG